MASRPTNVELVAEVLADADLPGNLDPEFEPHARYVALFGQWSANERPRVTRFGGTEQADDLSTLLRRLTNRAWAADRMPGHTVVIDLVARKTAKASVSTRLLMSRPPRFGNVDFQLPPDAWNAID